MAQAGVVFCAKFLLELDDKSDFFFIDRLVDSFITESFFFYCVLDFLFITIIFIDNLYLTVQIHIIT